ncbi:phosphoribosyltransferase [Saccharothrix syringae]|uniref:Phosphoribosyltransferase n=1 Tax=Saccharothrix syringae TaxID=103733 RepID=A0A5Q0GTQ8_SACSY|nr:phosphoribosyltransferase [Saccharothrix syringae]QFZ17476.1 phosphoribosyltransferase [Saccharothrix syringae]
MPASTSPHPNLADWKLEPSGSSWLLRFRCPPEVADHVFGALPDAEPLRNRGTDPRWPYRLRLDSAPPADLADFLALLGEVLVVPVNHEALDAVLALDHRMQLDGSARTDRAEQLHLVKHGGVPAEVDRAGQELVAALAEAVIRHEWYVRATRVLPVPGHEPPRPAASVLLGLALAQDLGLGLTPVTGPARKPARLMTARERVDLLSAFRVDEDLTGRTVLVVDDAYQSGYTMAGVANAARRAGATTVLGLTAVWHTRR